MMKTGRWQNTRWTIFLGIALVVLSVILYLIHFGIFRDVHHIFIYLVGDIAFVPIEVFLVTLIIHRLLSDREKKSIRNKLNMVIGVFFSEVGTKLLTFLSDKDEKNDIVRSHLSMAEKWDEKDFTDLTKKFQDYKSEIKITPEELADLKVFLVGKRDFLLRMLENPNLLEHESFTDLLWAVFHLTEELESVEDFRNIPKRNYTHLISDTVRAYDDLVYQWIAYMHHLKKSYPYIFSMSIRTSPFHIKSSPIRG